MQKSHLFLLFWKYDLYLAMSFLYSLGIHPYPCYPGPITADIILQRSPHSSLLVNTLTTTNLAALKAL